VSSRRPSLDARASVVGFDRDAQSHAAGAQATAAPGRQVAGLLSRQLSNQAAAQRPSENALTQPLASALSPAEGSQQHAAATAECAARERYADVEAALTQSGFAVCATPLVRKAFAVARSAHDGQERKSGDSVLSHAVATALILAELGLDDTVVAAGLLHDTLDDTMLTSAQLEALFPGSDVPALVAGVTAMSGASQLHRDAVAMHSADSLPEHQVAGMRAMLLAMADVRVVLIKLADRLHNMRTLSALPSASQQRVASETLSVFAPLAARLGVWALKAEMEDLCFAVLRPAEASHLSAALNGASVAADVERAVRALSERLAACGVHVTSMVGRPKNLYSTWCKLQRKGTPLHVHTSSGDDADVRSVISSAVLDARGLRCIVADEAACYAALDAIHALWSPVPGKVKDYIASPKANGYRSLHTVVSLPGNDGATLEVQLRTPDMHAAAEYGLAAHWRYKTQQSSGSGGSSSEDEDEATDSAEVEGGLFLEHQVAWARFLLTWHRDGGGPRADACLAAGCVFPVHSDACPHAHASPSASHQHLVGAPDARHAPVYVMVRDFCRNTGRSGAQAAAPRFRVVALPRGEGSVKALRQAVGPLPAGATVLVNYHPRDDIQVALASTSSSSTPPTVAATVQLLAPGDVVDIVPGPGSAARQQQPRRTKAEAQREAVVTERARLMQAVGLQPLPAHA